MAPSSNLILSRRLSRMSKLSRGLYEILITEAIEQQLGNLDSSLVAIRSSLRVPEAADRIALHLARVVERAIAAIDEDERIAIGISLARRLIAVSYTHLRAHETGRNLVCRLLLE